MKFFSLIYQGAVHISGKHKRIPAKEFSVLVKASEILAKAKKDAAELRSEFEQEKEQVRERTREEGFQEGLTHFYDKLVWFDHELVRLRIELQQQILPIALKVAKKIVAQELSLHPERIVDIVMQQIAPIAQSRRISIFVNKADREPLEAARLRIKEKLECVESFTIHERSDIEPGGCIIETEAGVINATMAHQWDTVAAVFKPYMKS